MEYVYAALLLHAAGKEISEENMKRVLEAAGVSPDEARIRALVEALKEVNIEEAIQSAAVPVPTAPGAATTAEKPAAEEKEEKKEEEKKEEEATAGLASLFG